jgi:Zn-dependent protease with chaperone function
MTTIEGHYFDGCRPIAIKARMDFMDCEAALTAESISLRFKTNELIVSPRVGSTYRFIGLPNGGQFGCADNALFDSVTQESKSEAIVAWLEERWIVAVACVAVISLILVIGYLFGLPAAAERIASRIPMETERILGTQALTYMDERGWLKPTQLESDARQEIKSDFEQLCSDLPLRKYYHLEFRAGGVFGPNAIALPGGIIVITDEMIETAKEKEEVLAVLAHEIGHVELRHAMRGVLQSSIVGVIAAMLTSDAASLSAAVTAFPVVLARMKYSRNFETAADEYAFGLLKQKGYSPNAFASLMERLSKESREDMGPFAWISTHPVTAERVKRARAAAAE